MSLFQGTNQGVLVEIVYAVDRWRLGKVARSAVQQEVLRS